MQQGNYPPGAQNDSRAPYNQTKADFELKELETEYTSANDIEYPIIIEYSIYEDGTVVDVNWVFKKSEPSDDFEFVKEGVQELIRFHEDKTITFE